MKIPQIPFLNKVLQKMKGSDRRNPYRDWFIIVCFFTGITVLVLAFAGGLYYEIDHGMIFRNIKTPESTPVQINRQAIENVSGYYLNQEKTVSSLVSSGTTTPVDPAL